MCIYYYHLMEYFHKMINVCWILMSWQANSFTLNTDTMPFERKPHGILQANVLKPNWMKNIPYLFDTVFIGSTIWLLFCRQWFKSMNIWIYFYIKSFKISLIAHNCFTHKQHLWVALSMQFFIWFQIKLIEFMGKKLWTFWYKYICKWNK